MADPATLLSLALALASGFLLVLGVAGLIALVKGAGELRRLLRSTSSAYLSVLLKSPLVPGVSVLMVAREATPEARSLARRLLDLHFGKHELVLVLDGPSEAERIQWIDELRLVPRERTPGGELSAQPVRTSYVSREPLKLLVVEKEAGGDADSYNAAINAAQFPVLGLVDPRAEFVPEWLLWLIRPLMENWDDTAAVCGVAPPAPAEGFAGRLGALESLRRWMVRGAAFARWRKLVPMPGCCMLMKRQSVIAAGGFRRGLLELFLDLYGGKQQIRFLPAPVSWTKAPATLAEVHEQVRYDQAQLAAGLRYRMARSSEFAGLFCMRVVRPVVETLALLGAGAGLALGWVSPALAAVVLLASAGTGIVLSTAAVVLREMSDPGANEPRYLARLFLTAIPENLGYRQIRNLWLIAGFLSR
jgi:cellulose synthase/poly-beta-1,6-N-acetylglucosamine synthase-like glycosyltransferase